VTDIPWASGGNASWPTAWKACKTPHAPGDPGLFPPAERVAVLTIATSRTADHDRPVNGWTLDEIAQTIINEAHAATISRATVQRILAAADLKPHKSVYWLNSHDPDFEAIAKEVCGLYVQAPTFYQQGRLLLCCDEKTGMQVLGRPFPTQLPEPGKPAKREFEYIRLGTQTMITTFVVATGEVVWDLGPTRTNLDFRAHVLRVAKHFPGMTQFDWIVDNLNTHMSLELCEVVAYLCGLPLTPKEWKTQEQRRAWLSQAGQAHLPLPAAARIVAESGGDVVQRAGAAVPAAGRLHLDGGIQGAFVAVHGGLQPGQGAPIPVDVHGGTLGACHTVQSDPTTADARAGLVWHSPPTV
jgi:hypothetical protein